MGRMRLGGDHVIEGPLNVQGHVIDSGTWASSLLLALAIDHTNRRAFCSVRNVDVFPDNPHVCFLFVGQGSLLICSLLVTLNVIYDI